MNYVVLLERVADGKRITRRYESWQNHTKFWWTEGNFSCDCNRHDTWLRAEGVPEEEILMGEPPCGNARYKALSATLDDGTVILLD